MNTFNVYKVSARHAGADRPHLVLDFLDDSTDGALGQAKAVMPHDANTQFLVALCPAHN